MRDFQFCERRLLSKRLFQILILTKQVFSSGKIARRRIFYFLGGQVLRILAAELLVKFRCSYLPNYSETTRALLRDSVVVLENFLPSKKFKDLMTEIKSSIIEFISYFDYSCKEKH